MKNEILNKIYENKIIAVTRGIEIEKIVETVGALLEGGITLFEVPLNQKYPEKLEEGLKSLELLKEKFKDKICVGTGTVLTVEQAARAAEAGADYIISPIVDAEIINKTKELGRISVAGAFTPTEIFTAYNKGADIIKLFPAGILGVDYIKAVLAPLNHIPVMAFAGIDINSVDGFIKAGAIGVGIGGELVDKKAIYEGDFKKLTKLAQEYIKKIGC